MKAFTSVLIMIAASMLACNRNHNTTGTQPEAAVESAFQVATNLNVETMGIIFALAEDTDWLLENSNKRDDSYFLKLHRQHFAAFADHEAVAFLDSLAEEKVLSIGSPFIGLHYGPLPELRLVHPPVPSMYEHTGLSEQEFTELMLRWAEQVRSFYQAADLKSFFAENASVYHRIEEEVASSIPGNTLADSMRAFFGHGNEVELRIVPSPAMFSQWGFGHQIGEKGDAVFYQLLSHSQERPWTTWDEISLEEGLGFDDQQYNLEFSVHEFGHSYVRFLDKPENRALVSSNSHLENQEMQEAMAHQWQDDSWGNIFEEHLVRSIEVLMLEKAGMEEAAREKVRIEVEENSFLYLESFLLLLRKYDRHRTKYRGLEEFLPELVAELPGLVN